MKKHKGPEVVEKTQAEIDTIIEAIKHSNLSESSKEFVIKCVQLACWLPMILQKKDISLSRLKKMIFGKGNRAKNKKGGNDSDGGNSPASTNSDSESDTSSDKGTAGNQGSDVSIPSNRNGRNSHTQYSDYKKESISVKGLTAGDRCPEGCGGKLYVLPSGVAVRISGQSIAKVTKYYLEKLRCNVCGYYISATLPISAGVHKYTASFKAQLAMMKFYLGIPYHRLEQYQQVTGCPLPDATQWNLIEQLGSHCYIIFSRLQYLAANGNLVYNDDTPLKILETMVRLQQEVNPKRTGMYTTCIMGEHEGHKIALYLNGTLHSGENLEKLLAKRDKEKPVILQMSDALPANTSTDIVTLSCYCLSHGFRKFDDLKDFFPAECLYIMHELSQVFAIDKKTRNMDDDERLLHHQTHSQPIMFALYEKIEDMLSDRRIEPNGDLADALNYLKNHWIKLTRFLSVPGAPLCNNIVERALKLAIRTRKNSLFYKTTYSANLSGMITSIIYTCQLNGINPIDYLTALQEHKDKVSLTPNRWLPWNYQENLQPTTPPLAKESNPLVIPHTQGSLAATTLATAPPG